MNENNFINYSITTLFFKSVSVIIALIMFESPMPAILAVPIVMFLPMLIGSPIILSIVLHVYNLFRPVFYVAAIISTIIGNQDMVAIAFYIISAIQIPSMLSNLLQTISFLVLLIKNK